MYDIIKEVRPYVDEGIWLSELKTKVFDIVSASFNKRVFGNEHFSYEVWVHPVDVVIRDNNNKIPSSRDISLVMVVTLKKPNLVWLYDCYKNFADTAIDFVLEDSEFKEMCDKYRAESMGVKDHTNEMILLDEVFSQFKVSLFELYYNYGGGARFAIHKYMDQHMNNLFQYEEVSIYNITTADKLSQIFGFVSHENLQDLNNRLFPEIKNRERVDVLPERKKKHAMIVFETLKEGTIEKIPYSLVPIKPNDILYVQTSFSRFKVSIMGDDKKDYVILDELNPMVYFEDTSQGHFNENKLGVGIDIGIVVDEERLKEVGIDLRPKLGGYDLLSKFDDKLNLTRIVQVTEKMVLGLLDKFKNLGVNVKEYRLLVKPMKS